MTTKPQVATTHVTVIATKGASTLVEYLQGDLLQRKYVPASLVANRFVANDVLERGIPYGYPWDEIDLQFDGRQFAVEMINAGLWTVEDVLKEPKKLTGVLRRLFETQIKAVLEAALQEKKRS